MATHARPPRLESHRNAADRATRRQAAIETRQLQHFARQLGQVTHEAMRARQDFLAQFARLDAEPALAATRARRLGVEYGRLFEQLRIALRVVPAPMTARPCVDAFDAWLERHLAACDSLARIGLNGETSQIGLAARMLAEARVAARRFNQAHREIGLARAA
ncbi:MAG: hypothetical protein EPO26_10980 [Chloroflexota bacterium]|nr:MAG: hypothetical protein EPO26_10980 [Chloroflexota bacterium]